MALSCSFRLTFGNWRRLANVFFNRCCVTTEFKAAMVDFSRVNDD